MREVDSYLARSFGIPGIETSCVQRIHDRNLPPLLPDDRKRACFWNIAFGKSLQWWIVLKVIIVFFMVLMSCDFTDPGLVFTGLSCYAFCCFVERMILILILSCLYLKSLNTSSGCHNTAKCSRDTQPGWNSVREGGHQPYNADSSGWGNWPLGC